MARRMMDAVATFVRGLNDSDEAAVLRSLSLGVIGRSAEERFQGQDAVTALLGELGDHDWTLDYRMDSEALLASPSGDSIRVVLDCGRISFLDVRRAVALAA